MAAEAVERRAHTDRFTVSALADQLHDAAGVARRGAEQIAYAKQNVLDAVQNAEQARFTVSQDFSVSSRETGTPAQLAVRQVQAEGFAAVIRVRVGELIAADRQTAFQITTATTNIGTLVFSYEPSSHDGTP